MTRFLLALVLSLSLSTVALAKEIVFTGCTTDKQSVQLLVDINDDLAAQHPVVAHIGLAFLDTAGSMTAEELRGELGFITFLSWLDVFDAEAINGVEQPYVTGPCE